MAFWDKWFSGGKTESNVSSLDAAVATGNLYDIQKALAAGADPNIKNTGGGNTPLLVAAATGNRDMIERLLDMGGKIEFNDAANKAAVTAVATPQPDAEPAALTQDIEVRKPLTLKRKS